MYPKFWELVTNRKIAIAGRKTTLAHPDRKKGKRGTSDQELSSSHPRVTALVLNGYMILE